MRLSDLHDALARTRHAPAHLHLQSRRAFWRAATLLRTRRTETEQMAHWRFTTKCRDVQSKERTEITVKAKIRHFWVAARTDAQLSTDSRRDRIPGEVSRQSTTGRGSASFWASARPGAKSKCGGDSWHKTVRGHPRKRLFRWEAEIQANAGGTFNAMQSKAKQSKAKQSKAKRSEAERSGAERSEAKRSKAKQGKSQQNK